MPTSPRALVELFRARFDPEGEPVPERAPPEQVRAIEAALEAVENLSEDRVLRQYLALILATTRTNFWRRDAAGKRKSFLSFKFDPSKVPGLPEPKPMFEIFVYSTRFEGVHLRGGKVARGGLRWSDRPEDFRTEVLGLVKAQMVKNVRCPAATMRPGTGRVELLRHLVGNAFGSSLTPAKIPVIAPAIPPIAAPIGPSTTSSRPRSSSSS